MKLAFFLFFSFATVWATSSLKNKALVLLPPPLNQFEMHKTTLTEVETKLGKASLVEGNHYYWEKEGLKYAVKLSFNNKFVLDTLHYTFQSEKPEVEKLGKIDTKKLEPYISSGKPTKYMVLKEKELEVVIDPVFKKVYSVKIP